MRFANGMGGMSSAKQMDLCGPNHQTATRENKFCCAASEEKSNSNR